MSLQQDLNAQAIKKVEAYLEPGELNGYWTVVIQRMSNMSKRWDDMDEYEKERFALQTRELIKYQRRCSQA